MGKIKQGILGGFSGKVGTVVGGVWKGIDYMRSLATSIDNVKSPAQLIVRANFSAIVKMMAKANPILKLSNWRLAKKQSAFNAGVRINYKSAVIDGAIDMEKITFGEFKVAPLANLDAQLGTLDSLLVLKALWTNDADEDRSFADDMVMAVVVRMSANGELGDVIIDYLSATRQDESIVIPIASTDSLTSGDRYYAYMGSGSDPKNPKQVINIPAGKIKHVSTMNI